MLSPCGTDALLRADVKVHELLRWCSEPNVQLLSHGFAAEQVHRRRTLQQKDRRKQVRPWQWPSHGSGKCHCEGHCAGWLVASSLAAQSKKLLLQATTA